MSCIIGQDITQSDANGVCPTGSKPLDANGQLITAPVPSGATQAKNDSGNDFGYWLARIIYIFTVGFGSVVLALAAVVLNFTISISLDSAAYGLTFISEGWTILRDLANMAFIFILVYIAMKVMFEAHTAGTMGLLAKVLAVALVINFSFFATRVVIDAGNLISVQFYNAIVSDASSAAPAVANTPIGPVTTPSGVPDITQNIMSGINFVSLLGPDSFNKTSGGNMFADFVSTLITFSFIYIVMGAMLFMLAAAFITAGIKFIIRIVMLWGAIITAPIALVAWSFGGGGGHGGHGGGGGFFGTWRKNLIAHAFYPAIFLFVMLLISKFMGAQGSAGLGGSLLEDSLQGGDWQHLVANVANVVVRLGFVLVMLYFALKADDYFQVAGSSFAKTWGNNLTFGLGTSKGYGRYLGFLGNRTARVASSPISQPLGSFASLSNATLKRTGALNRNDLLGTAARATSRNVLQPLTKTSFAGEKSFSQLQKDQKERDNSAKGRDLINRIIKTEDLSKVSDDDKKELNKLNANMFLGVPDATLERLSHGGVINEGLSKKIHDSSDFGEDTKHTVEHAVEAHKAEETNESLNKINDSLGKLTTATEDGSRSIETILKENRILDKNTSTALRKAFQKKLDEAQINHKEQEMQLRTAVEEQTRAEKAGNAADATHARETIKSIKETMIKTKTEERNASEGLKKLEKAPKEKEDKPAAH